MSVFLDGADASRLAYIASVSRHGKKALAEILSVRPKLVVPYARRACDAIMWVQGVRRKGPPPTRTMRRVVAGFLDWALGKDR